MNNSFYKELFLKLKSSKKEILVIGDLMLDRYLHGNITRISPEAPVPIIKIDHEENKLGGSGNVANNISNYGIRARLISSIGNDNNGKILISLLKEKKISTTLIFKKNDQTTTKIRSIASNQQLIRQDYDCQNIALSDNDINKIMNSISEKISVIVLSDYAKGFLTNQLCKKIIQRAEKFNIPVIVDPKGNDVKKYEGSYAITPNKKEAIELSMSENIKCDLEANLKIILKKYHIKNIIMTDGKNGIQQFSKNQFKHYPANSPKQVFDVSGAGDTVIGTIAAVLHAGYDLESSIKLANIAASMVIQKVGTEAIQLEELESYFTKNIGANNEKIMKIGDLKFLTDKLKKENKIIGFTNGCFDILHSGHVSYLEEAKKKVDFLILGLNTDYSIKRIKGDDRPVVDELNRAKVLSGLSSIDAIIFFDEKTPLKLITSIKPDALIKGSDYKINEVIGSKEMNQWGGKVFLIDLIPGQSSSKIIKKINKK